MKKNSNNSFQNWKKAEALETFDKELFESTVEEIQVNSEEEIIFKFKDGSEIHPNKAWSKV